MKKNNTIERDINKIRISIYEETKDMTPEQRVKYTRERTEPIIQKYGLKVIPNAGSRTVV